MKENNNINCFDHTASAEKVINSQIEELKTEISSLALELEEISCSTNKLVFTEGRVAELTYKINKLKSQLERLTKEEEPE